MTGKRTQNRKHKIHGRQPPVQHNKPLLLLPFERSVANVAEGLTWSKSIQPHTHPVSLILDYTISNSAGKSYEAQVI